MDHCKTEVREELEESLPAWPWAARFLDHGLLLDRAVALPTCLQHAATVLHRAACPTQGTVHWPVCLFCLLPLPHFHLNHLRKELLSVVLAASQWPPQAGSPRHYSGAAGAHMLIGPPDSSLIPQSHLSQSAGALPRQVTLPAEPLLDKVALFCLWGGLCSVCSPASGAGHEESGPQLWPSAAASHTPCAGYAKAAVSTRDSSQQLLQSHCNEVLTHQCRCLTACMLSPTVSVCTCSRLQPPAGQACNERSS